MSDSLSSGSGASEITAQFRSATVRIFNQRDAVVGAGVLVAERHLVTCAHVVAGALGTRGTDTVPSPGNFRSPSDFPLMSNCRIRV